MSIPASDLAQVADMRVRAIYGTVEKMHTTPNWIECKERLDYLNLIEERIKIGLQIESKRYSLFNLYKRICVLLSKLMVNKVLFPQIKKLKDGYALQLECPIGFLVGHLDEMFQQFIIEHKGVIRAANYILNIKDDPYVRE